MLKYYKGQSKILQCRRNGFMWPLRSTQVALVTVYIITSIGFILLFQITILDSAIFYTNIALMTFVASSWFLVEIIDPSSSSSWSCMDISWLLNIKTGRLNKIYYCASCRKKVPGLDHHCNWLNNCVGQKNYAPFFALLIFSTSQNLLQSVVGVLVQINLNDSSLGDIRSLFGSENVFAYYILATVFTLLSTLMFLGSSLVLGFHVYLVLIAKMGTYEWISRQMYSENSYGSDIPSSSIPDESKRLAIQEQWQLWPTQLVRSGNSAAAKLETPTALTQMSSSLYQKSTGSPGRPLSSSSLSSSLPPHRKRSLGAVLLEKAVMNILGGVSTLALRRGGGTNSSSKIIPVVDRGGSRSPSNSAAVAHPSSSSSSRSHRRGDWLLYDRSPESSRRRYIPRENNARIPLVGNEGHINDGDYNCYLTYSGNYEGISNKANAQISSPPQSSRCDLDNGGSFRSRVGFRPSSTISSGRSVGSKKAFDGAVSGRVSEDLLRFEDCDANDLVISYDQDILGGLSVTGDATLGCAMQAVCNSGRGRGAVNDDSCGLLTIADSEDAQYNIEIHTDADEEGDDEASEEDRDRDALTLTANSRDGKLASLRKEVHPCGHI